jgi:hypothetical protein
MLAKTLKTLLALASEFTRNYELLNLIYSTTGITCQMAYSLFSDSYWSPGYSGPRPNLLAHQPPSVTSSNTLLQAYDAPALYGWTIKIVGLSWLIVVACAVEVAGIKSSSLSAPLHTSLACGFPPLLPTEWIGCRGPPLLSWE